MSDFKVGDKIYHKSNPSIKWIVEGISENEVNCSTLIKETLEQKKEVFTITSIEKWIEPTITIGKRTRRNYW